MVIDDLVVAPDTSLLETMRVIDRTGMEVALVADAERRLLAIATDGDIRRAIIAGQPLSVPILNIANRRFTAVGPEVSRQEALARMIERGFACLPVIDGEGRLIDLHTLTGTLVVTKSESWAVVMAGGKGERLGELTQAIPKPMLPIGDKPILERIVLHLAGHGIRRIFLSVNHYGRMIEDHFGDGRRWLVRIDYLWEERPLGTAGALGLLPEPPRAPLVVMNGDLLTAINISRLLAFHRAGEFAATMALREHKVQVPFGVAEVEGHRVARLVEKPSLHYRINAGIYVLSPAAVARVPRRQPCNMTDLIAGLLADQLPVGAYHMQETWNDIGLPDEFARAQRQG